MEELKKEYEEPSYSGSIKMNSGENGVLSKEELLRSGEKYHTLFTSIDEGFGIIEVLFDDNNKAVDYRFLEANPAFEKQTGLRDAVGKTMRELAPNHEEWWYETFGEVAISKKAKRFESFASQLAGGVWYDVFAFPYDAEGKNELGILFKDVTELKKTGAGMRESEERKSFLLKLNKSVHHLSDPLEVEETITRIGRDYFKTDRCYYAEIENGKAIIRRDIAKDDLPSVAGVYDIADMPRFKKVLDAGEPFVVDDVRSSNLVDETLRQLCIELLVISFIDVPVIKNNEPVGILCLVQSTPRKWTEIEVSLAEEIAEQTWAAAKRVVTEQLLLCIESKLRAIIESSPIAMVFTGRDGEILFRNPRFDLLWGRPRIQQAPIAIVRCMRATTWMAGRLHLRSGRAPVPYLK